MKSSILILCTTHPTSRREERLICEAREGEQSDALVSSVWPTRHFYNHTYHVHTALVLQPSAQPKDQDRKNQDWSPLYRKKERTNLPFHIPLNSFSPLIIYSNILEFRCGPAHGGEMNRGVSRGFEGVAYYCYCRGEYAKRALVNETQDAGAGEKCERRRTMEGVMTSKSGQYSHES